MVFYFFKFLRQCVDLDGAILCFENTSPAWSYAATDSDGYVTEVKEKKVISNKATIGLYYFAKGSLFVQAAKEMITAGDRQGMFL